MPTGRRLRFAPRPWATAVTAAAVFLFVALGNWQLDRAAEKRALAADFVRAGPAVELSGDSRDLPRYQRVTARGRYDSDRQFLLDNRVHAGQAGVEVLTPLLLDGGGAVLVNRGWQPFGPTREQFPDTRVSAESRSVAGRLDELPRAGIALDSAPGAGWPRLVHYPSIEDLVSLYGRELQPRMILLDPGEPDGFTRDWMLPGTTPIRHLGYAIQWFALAATAVSIWFALGLKRLGENG